MSSANVTNVIENRCAILRRYQINARFQVTTPMRYQDLSYRLQQYNTARLGDSLMDRRPINWLQSIERYSTC